MGVFDDDAAAADGDVRARLNLRYGIDVQPDAAARDRALARRYGLPQGLVQTYRPDYEAQARMDDAAPVLSQSPKLRDWLAADAGRAEVAHDDLPQLSAVEQAIRILKGSGGALLSGVNKFNEGAWGVARAGAELLPDVIGRPMAETFAEYGRTERGRAAALMPQADGNLSAGWYSGLQSLGLNLVQLPAVLATGGGAGALGMMGAVTGGQSYAQARDHGVGKAESLLFGTSQGVIEAGTEKLSIGPLMKLLQPGKLGAKALEYMLKEQGGEQIATALQDLNEWAVLPENQGKTFGDYMDARPDAIIQTAIATAVGGGGQVALMKGLAAITQRMGGDQERAQQAEQRAELMGQLGELAAASKVLQRDADTFQEFVAQAAGEDSPATDVYIDAQVLQQSGMAEQLAQVSPAVAEQFQAALQTGGDVRIPLAEYATRVAGTPLNQGLLDHIRLQPDDYSRADAKVFMQQHGEQLQADVARVIEQHSADADWQAGRDAVRADFARQLDEVGRWHADVNRQYAALLGDYYAATAARAGMTPQELAARYPLRIQAKAGQGATLEQPGPGLDAVRQQWSGAGIKHAVHEKNGVITLSQIIVPKGGREAGVGTRAMQALVDYADRTGQHIALTPSGDFGGNKRRLVQFYKRFGFVENKGRNRAFTTSDGMYRQAPGKVLEQFAGANAATAVAQPARGQIAFGQDITQTPSVISLFDGADWSTLIHESGHFFLEAHMDLAGRIAGRIAEGEQVSDGERGIVADANALLGWFGVAESPEASALSAWHAMTLDEKRAFHEQFARGFERYALDGKAPSLSLQSVFQRFGAWLKNVYRSITQRSADDVLQVRLTDEVRQVMDRMIATDEQIREAEAVREMGPLFGTAEQAGMAPDDWTRYHELAAQATAQATERLQARSLKNMQWLRNARSRELKRMQARAAGLRREVQIEARREVLQRPVYRAWQFLTTKGDAAATAQPTPRVKASGALDNSMDNLFTAIAKLGGLRREDVAKAWGVDPKDRLESGVFGAPVLRKEGGLSIDAMAERLVEEGYLLPGEDGKADVADLEAAFDSQRRGVDQFSTWHDYAERAKAANGGDVPEALPEEIAHGKLDTNALRDMYGTGPDALWRTLSTRRMTSEANGIHPDVVAETFGFSSGDELARALAEAEPPRQAIDALTDQWMMERYADLATPDALERAVDDALHNEARTRMVAAELQALQDAANPRGAAELDKRGRTQSLLPKAARDVAQVMISRLKIRDLRPLQYTAAEGRAARAAAKSLQAGDMAQAAAHKRSQLLQAAAARAAMDARDEADRARAYLKRMADGPKGLPADYRDQINALLERHDLRARSDKDNDRRASMSAWMLSQLSIGNIPQFSESLLSPEEARSYRADLQQRDESGNLIYEDEGKAAERLAAGIERSRAVPWRDLTVEQMRGLVDAVKQIEHLGRLKGKLLAKRDAASFDAARDAIVAGIVQYGGEAKPLPARRTRNDALGKAWQAVVAFGASHIKVSTWARRMDGGTDNGAVWRHFVRPANEAASRESTMRAEATAGLMEILQPVLKRVPMTEMSGRGRHFPTIGDSLNWQERFALALNTGNEGNLQRLLDGHGWTRQQIDPVLQSLTVDEWVAVQQVWDFFERYRPQIGELEKRTAGREPEWVQPMPQRVRASSGQMVDLRGGYYPIKYDPRQSARAESHQGAEEAKAMMRAANLAASTRRSFVKQRAEEVKGRPLLLNMQGLYGGVNDVIHDLCWREWLMDTGKLLRSDAVQEAIRAHWGAHVTHEFRRWTEDIAAGSRRLDHGVEKAVGFVRQNVSLASLGFNVLNAAQQITGYANSVARVGAVPMARALAGMAGSPRRMTREAMAASEFLRNRTRTRFRELNELRNQVEGQTTAREMIGRYGYWMSMRMQLLVDVSTWWAAHDAAIAAGHDEAAVALADQAVKDAQGGGEEVDQAGIERGGPLVKLFSTFYSYMGATLNTAVLAGTAPGSHAKRAANVLLVLSVPAMLGMLVKDLLTPGGDDDEDPEKLARRLAAEQLSFLFGMVVVGREAQFLGKQIMGENAFGYSGPSGLRFFSDLQKLGGQTMQGEFDEAWLKSFVSVTGDLTGLPSTQVNRIISGAYAIERGDVSGPVETVAAPVFGFQRQN